MAASASAFRALIEVIVAGDTDAALRLLAAAPDLATAAATVGATREAAASNYFDAINHYLYGGDTALHMAAAGYRLELVRKLLAMGADARARNRRGAEPLHYAADGVPGSRAWSPAAQVATIRRLIAAGADPNATDMSGVAPLHRAVRTRCGAAVRALLEGGADVRRANKSGSTPLQLAMRTTGRGGSGEPAAKTQQAEIALILAQHGAA
jgi:hypothetical protein